jgi:hypothetical protein
MRTDSSNEYREPHVDNLFVATGLLGSRRRGGATLGSLEVGNLLR